MPSFAFPGGIVEAHEPVHVQALLPEFPVQALDEGIVGWLPRPREVERDVAHVDATIRLFTEPGNQRARYMASHGFFKEGEIADICVRHLEVDGEMTTRELAKRVIAERKPDVTDTTLRNAVVFEMVRALRHAKHRRLVRPVQKRKGTCVWMAGEALTPPVAANSLSISG
jgi:hypothetical protein